DAFSGGDRGSDRLDPGKAPRGPGGGGGETGGGRVDPQGRRPDLRGDKSRPRRGRARGHLPAGPAVPSARLSDPAPATPRAPGRHPSARRPPSRAHDDGGSEAAARLPSPDVAGARALRLARERAPASQRDPPSRP